MKEFFSTFPSNFLRSFSFKRLWLHLAAIILTYFIVASDFDWWWYTHTSKLAIEKYFFAAVFLGMVVPIIAPLGFILLGRLKSVKAHMTGWALAQAALVGVLVSWLYKAFTGRIPPAHANFLTDISHGFQFGWLKGGVFYGWPSSHTTVAFATAVCFCVMYRKNKIACALALVYAFYIGLGVSMNIHWFSEFVAGAFIGTAVGLTVGKHWHQYTNR